MTDLSTVYTTFDEVRIFDGSRVVLPRAEFFSTALGAALGLTDRLEVSFFVPHDNDRLAAAIPAFGIPARRYTQFTDGRVALKYFLSDQGVTERFGVATQLELKMPLAQYATDTLSAPGDSQTDVTWRMLAGTVFDDDSLIRSLSGSVGYRFRARDPADEFVGTLEVDFKPIGRFQASVVLDTVRSRGDVGLLDAELIRLAVRQGGVVPFAVVAETYTKASAILNYDFGKGLSARIYGSESIEVRNSSFDSSMGLALSYEFQ